MTKSLLILLAGLSKLSFAYTTVAERPIGVINAVFFYDDAEKFSNLMNGNIRQSKPEDHLFEVNRFELDKLNYIDCSSQTFDNKKIYRCEFSFLNDAMYAVFSPDPYESQIANSNSAKQLFDSLAIETNNTDEGRSKSFQTQDGQLSLQCFENLKLEYNCVVKAFPKAR